MQFLYPAFLFALFTLLIPVLIHLFNFRRYKQVVFSDIRFLQQIEDTSKSRRRLRDWLVLASRFLALGFLILAFAQPFIPVNEQNVFASRKTAFIYIDNSFSMLQEGSNGPLLETAKEKARAVVEAMGNEGQCCIVTNQRKTLRWTGKPESIQRIDEITVVPFQKDLTRIQHEVKDAFSGKENSSKQVYIVSDFQTAALKAGQITPDTAFQWNFLITQGESIANIFLDSVWIRNPLVRAGKPVELFFRLHNESDQPVQEITVTLKINGMQKGLRKADIGAHGFAETSITFEAVDGWQQGELSIEDFPLVFDDHLFFVLKAAGAGKVLCVNQEGSNEPMKRLLSGDPDFLFQEVNQHAMDYSLIDDFQLIVLNELASVSTGFTDEIKRYAEQGGQVLIIPPVASPSDGSVNALLRQLNSVSLGPLQSNELRVASIHRADPFYRDVFLKIPTHADLPVVKQCYALQAMSETTGRSILQLNNQQPFIWVNALGKGRVFVSAVPFHRAFSNFTEHALFVPTMLKMALGTGRSIPLYHILGEAKPVPVYLSGAGSKLLKLSGDGFSYTGERMQRNGQSFLTIPEELNKPGIYQLASLNEPSQMKIAFNYNREESRMKMDQEADLVKHAKIHIAAPDVQSIQGQIIAEQNGRELWRWMLAMAALFLLAEMALLRWMK